MKKLILLGGIPGVGKTTIAYELARIYKNDKILSTDIIKNIIKTFVTKEEEEYLYTTTHGAYKLEKLDIISGYKKHSHILNQYILNILKNFKDDKLVILEGATINSDILKYLNEYKVYYFNLYLDDEKELIERYKNKLKIRKGTWIENIEIIKEINTYLINQSKINIKTNNIDEAIKSIRRYIDENICD